MGCRAVDRVILTHFDDDHINGVEHLLARMVRGDTDDPETRRAARRWTGLLELAERYGMDVETVTEETHLPFGNARIDGFSALGRQREQRTGAHCAGFGGGA